MTDPHILDCLITCHLPSVTPDPFLLFGPAFQATFTVSSKSFYLLLQRHSFLKHTSVCTMASRLSSAAVRGLSCTRIPRSPGTKRHFKVLAIETSADDTCAAIVDSSRKIHSNIVMKQHHMWGDDLFHPKRWHCSTKIHVQTRSVRWNLSYGCYRFTPT